MKRPHDTTQYLTRGIFPDLVSSLIHGLGITLLVVCTGIIMITVLLMTIGS